MHALSLYSYEAPAAWAAYLVNGDHSGLEESEIAEADAMLSKVTEWIGNGQCVGCSEESTFRYRPREFGTLGGDFLTYDFLA